MLKAAMVIGAIGLVIGLLAVFTGNSDWSLCAPVGLVILWFGTFAGRFNY